LGRTRIKTTENLEGKKKKQNWRIFLKIWRLLGQFLQWKILRIIGNLILAKIRSNFG
jgi:hypothetical protein